MGILKYFPQDTRGVIITAKSENDSVDFVSRFFCPRLGVLEDPVSGSVHTTVTPYWAKKLGRNILKAEQASLRKGFLGLEIDGDLIRITGQACQCIEGEFTVPL